MTAVVVAALALAIGAQMLIVSGYQHRAAQQRAYDKFRKELAEGTAPVGQTVSPDSTKLLRLGAPVALIKIPAIGVSQVVLEGTTSDVLMAGPGHVRNTPLPGQAGISVIYGRQASYGGPFWRLHELKAGQRLTITTGEGVATFKVLDVRYAGNLTPPALVSGHGRITLVTAAGTPFVPSGVVRVDADLVSPVVAGVPSVLPANAVLPAEKLMANDPTTLWALVLWLQGLIIVAMAAVWSWYRWGRQQTWVVFFPLVSLVGLFATGQFMKLLPNVL